MGYKQNHGITSGEWATKQNNGITSGEWATKQNHTPTCSFSARDFSREGVKVPTDTRARFTIKRERDDQGEIQSEVLEHGEEESTRVP
ncbi:hypothetical protein Baya_11743 [Bagarius yarrelli]|uniref:Uncharacterized protein n=1 Tax=Bagarius yarrelli TaxID=175774 RepID=A0A556V1E4_BAGYA|nr:hypothetical protein Baya_11743 [Bagarius yarrelli]